MVEQLRIKFWCYRCRKDWDIIGKKKIKSREVGEVWSARCPDCNREMIRLINNPRDPFYRVSRRLRVERKKYAKDLLQVEDPGFDTLYPEHKRKREEYYQKLEEQKWKETKKR